MLNLRYYQAIVFIFMSHFLVAQNISTPNLTCVSVELNGDVTANWDIVNDPMSEFDEYIINFEDVNATNETFTEGNIATTTTTQTLTGTPFYTVSVIAEDINGLQTPASNQMETIFLEVQNSSTGYADLSWNIPSSADGNWFYIYKDVDNTGFVLIDSVDVSQSRYQDEIYNCNLVRVNYRVMHRYSNSCESYSNVAGQDFEDILPPNEVQLTNLTVSGANEATLTWIASTEPDVVGYEILKLNRTSGVFNIVTTINNPAVTTFADSPTGATIEPQGYKIFAKDDCDNKRSIFYYNTLFVEHTYNQCGVLIDFSWNPYIEGQTANGEVDDSKAKEIATNYELWMDDGTGYAFVASIPKGTNSYTFNNVPINQNLCFQIRANLPSGEVSVSNEVCQFTTQPDVAQDNYIKSVNVLNEEEIQLDFYVNDIIANNKIRLYRSKDGGVFERIDSLASNSTVYIDRDVETDKSSYTYVFEMLDGCFNPREESNYANSILLNVDYGNYESHPNLSWNFYDNFNSSVAYYEVKRYVDERLSLYDTVTATQNFYNDDLVDVQRSSYSKICYEITAVEDTNNVYGFREKSVSNVYCLEDRATVYISSGFVIEGRSGNFKPVFTYITERDYRFMVFNRWGQIIFETNDPKEGWDGKYKGNYVAPGAYAYKLFYRDDLNEKKYMVGSVTVIR